jgi:uroporphyrinogen decarboxylase
MCSVGLSSRERVKCALRFEKPDRTPRDFAAAPAVWQRLSEHFQTTDRDAILRRLGVDCRVVSYDSFCRCPDVDEPAVDMQASLERSSTGGMWRRVEPDGSNRDIWGAHRRRITDGFAEHEHFASHPLAQAESVEDLKRYRWPSPDWWDFGGLAECIQRLNEQGPVHVRYRVGSVFETAWSLAGFEKFLLDLACQPELPCYIMERITEVHLENFRQVLETAGDGIDMVYFYDDIGTTTALLISPETYERCIQPFHQRLIDLAAGHGKPVMLHSCGAVHDMIPRWIDMGLNVLNPIQPLARSMDPERLAADFGGRIAFHGGIDIQELLPKGRPDEVRERVARVSEILGAHGGYIMAGSHHIQADAPLENVLAMYGTD